MVVSKRLNPMMIASLGAQNLAQIDERGNLIELY